MAGGTRKEPQAQPVARHPVGNAGEDQVELVQRLARAEELCDQSRAEAGSEERKMDVRRPPPSGLGAGLAVRDRIAARPDGAEPKPAGLLGHRPAPPRVVWIG